jgi:hypothetical protein
MRRHAEGWIDACNRRDLDGVLQVFALRGS